MLKEDNLINFYHAFILATGTAGISTVLLLFKYTFCKSLITVVKQILKETEMSVLYVVSQWVLMAYRYQ